MVAVAQLVEPRIVDPVVVGSSPISHPISGGTPCSPKENFQTLMSESSAPVPSASAPLTALASPAKGWVVFERDGDICPGILENESERRVRVVRAEGAFKILKTRVWPLFSVAPESEPAADALAAAAQAAARQTDPEVVWNAVQKNPAAPDDLAQNLPQPESAHAHPDFPRLQALSVALQNPAYFRRAGNGGFAPAPREEMEKARDSLSVRRVRRDAEREFAAELEAGRIPEEIANDAARLMTAPEKGSAAFRALKKHAGGDGPNIARFFIEKGVIPDAKAYFSALFEHAWRTRAAPEAEADLQLAEPPDWPAASASAFSVDDAGTTEVDDAFSAVVRGDGRWRIGVHIAAPAAVIARGSAVDKIARARGLSVYFPDDKRLMMPPEAVSACSLDTGTRRPALSFYFNFDPESGEMSGEDTVAERVHIAGAHTPEELNAGEVSPEAGEVFSRLIRVAEATPEENLHRPARGFKIRVRDGRPRVTLAERGPAEEVVEALMRKVNHAWGMMLAMNDNGIFRHRGMTVAAPEDPPYAWTSSPLRRYADLVNQRALLAMLSGDFVPPENWPALARQFDDRLVLARRHQRMMERYWALRALEERGDDAILDAEWRDDGRVRLLDFPLSGDIRGARPGAEGAEITVRATSINLLHLRVRFAPAKRV